MDNQIIPNLYRLSRILKIAGPKERYKYLKDPVSGKKLPVKFRYFVKKEGDKFVQKSLSEFRVDLNEAVNIANQFLVGLYRSLGYQQIFDKIEEEMLKRSFSLGNSAKIINSLGETYKVDEINLLEDEIPIAKESLTGKIPAIYKKFGSPREFDIAKWKDRLEGLTNQQEKLTERRDKVEGWVESGKDYLERSLSSEQEDQYRAELETIQKKLQENLKQRNVLEGKIDEAQEVIEGILKNLENENELGLADQNEKFLAFKLFQEEFKRFKDLEEKINEENNNLRESDSEEAKQRIADNIKEFQTAQKQLFSMASHIPYSDEKQLSVAFKEKAKEDLRKKWRPLHLEELMKRYFAGVNKNFKGGLEQHKTLPIPVLTRNNETKLNHKSLKGLQVGSKFNQNKDYPEIFSGSFKLKDGDPVDVDIIVHYDKIYQDVFEEFIRGEGYDIGKSIGITPHYIDVITYKLDSIYFREDHTFKESNTDKITISKILINPEDPIERGTDLFEYELSFRKVKGEEQRPPETHTYQYNGNLTGNVARVFLKEGATPSDNQLILQVKLEKLTNEISKELIARYKDDLEKYLRDNLSSILKSKGISSRIKNYHKGLGLDQDPNLVGFDKSILNAVGFNQEILHHTGRLPDNLTHSSAGLTHKGKSRIGNPSDQIGGDIALPASALSKIINRLSLGVEYFVSPKGLKVPPGGVLTLHDYLKDILIIERGSYTGEGLVHHMYDPTKDRPTAAHAGVQRSQAREIQLNKKNLAGADAHFIKDKIVVSDPREGSSYTKGNNIGYEVLDQEIKVNMGFGKFEIFHMSRIDGEWEPLDNPDGYDDTRMKAYRKVINYLNGLEKFNRLEKPTHQDQYDMLEAKKGINIVNPKQISFSEDHQKYDSLMGKYENSMQIPASAILKHISGGILKGENFSGDQANFISFVIDLVDRILKKMGYQEHLELSGDEEGHNVEDIIRPLEALRHPLTRKKRLELMIELTNDVREAKTPEKRHQVIEHYMTEFGSAYRVIQLKEQEMKLILLEFEKTFNPTKEIEADLTKTIKEIKEIEAELNMDIDNLEKSKSDMTHALRLLEKDPEDPKALEILERAIDEMPDAPAYDLISHLQDSLNKSGIKSDIAKNVEALTQEELDKEEQ